MRLKNWLLKTWIFAWAYRQGGVDSFAVAYRDIRDTMIDDTEKRAEELAKQKVEGLFSIVDMSQIITHRGNRIVLGGRLLEDIEIANLKAEAEFLAASEIWKVLVETPKHLAHKAMFVDDGKIENNLIKGRAMLYLLSTQEKIMSVVLS